MKKLKELPYDLAAKLDIQQEVLQGTCNVSISGGKFALIEEHRGVIEYNDSRTVIAFTRGKLAITGSGLKIDAMNRHELLLSGRIQTLEWG